MSYLKQLKQYQGNIRKNLRKSLIKSRNVQNIVKKCRDEERNFFVKQLENKSEISSNDVLKMQIFYRKVTSKENSSFLDIGTKIRKIC